MIDLSGYTFAFLDVETTGLASWFGDRVCEIAIVRTKGDEIADTFQALVNPERPISPGASRVNGLTDDDVCAAPRFAEVAERAMTLLEDAIIICHNAPFDLGFVDSEFGRLGMEFCAPRVIDTLEIARRDYDFYSNSLPVVAGILHIEVPQAHRAMADALTTRQVFYWFVGDLSRRGLQDLEELGEGYYSPKRSAQEVSLPPSVDEALKSGKRLHIVYVDRNGFETRRSVTPRQVLAFEDYVYLVAFCHTREAERNFRLDRIIAMTMES